MPVISDLQLGRHADRRHERVSLAAPVPHDEAVGRSCKALSKQNAGRGEEWLTRAAHQHPP